MAQIATRLIRQEEVSAETKSFGFEKPQGFDYEAGQHVTVEIPDGGKSRSHTFTLSSAPCEEELMITTRMRDSDYKRALARLSVSAEVRLRGPNGSLTLPPDGTAEAAFLAGGIGVTPFRSMLRQAAHDGRSGPITLFLSNHRPKDAPFYDELALLSRRLKNVELVGTMTRMNESVQTWNGETGHIDAEMLRRHLADLGTPTFYVAGPPDMVDAMQDMLRETGVDEERIQAEQFSGY